MIVAPFYPRASVVVPTPAEIRAQAIQSGNGPVPLAANFSSPLDRWTTLGDRTDTLKATFSGAICRIWGKIGALDPAASYNLEVRCVVKDVIGGTLALRTFLVPGGTAASVPVTPVQFDTSAVTLGNNTNQEPTFSGELDPVDTPTRLLVEVITGAVVALPTNPYLIYSVTAEITEV